MNKDQGVATGHGNGDDGINLGCILLICIIAAAILGTYHCWIIEGKCPLDDVTQLALVMNRKDAERYVSLYQDFRQQAKGDKSIQIMARILSERDALLDKYRNKLCLLQRPSGPKWVIYSDSESL